jgi:uncharacterized protein HemY
MHPPSPVITRDRIHDILMQEDFINRQQLHEEIEALRTSLNERLANYPSIEEINERIRHAPGMQTVYIEQLIRTHDESTIRPMIREELRTIQRDIPGDRTILRLIQENFRTLYENSRVGIRQSAFTRPQEERILRLIHDNPPEIPTIEQI